MICSAILPKPAPARVLACGAYLKNSACLIDDERVLWSAHHGDLIGAANRDALNDSVEELRREASGPVQAVAHDLHPDIHSTHVAHAVADRLGVPAIAVEHHHAHRQAKRLNSSRIVMPAMKWRHTNACLATRLWVIRRYSRAMTALRLPGAPSHPFLGTPFQSSTTNHRAGDREKADIISRDGGWHDPVVKDANADDAGRRGFSHWQRRFHSDAPGGVCESQV